jgi:hypothetical protein
MAAHQDCSWPDLAEPHIGALRAAVSYVLTTFGSTVGVVACGSIIRGNPKQSSDIDLYVIQTESFRQRIQRYFNGVPFEIFVNPPVMVRKYLVEESQSGRIITAHMLATGFSVLVTDPVVNALRSEAKLILNSERKASGDLTVPRYMIATLFEDALDVIDEDPLTARMILNEAIYQMLSHAFTKADRYIPRAKDLLRELGRIDLDLRRLAEGYYASASLEDQVELAKSICDKTIAARGFFEWDSGPGPLE